MSAALPPGWEERTSSAGLTYFANVFSGATRYERPTAAPRPASVRASHLLVKHTGSRRPSSWREERITRSQAAAERLAELRRGVVAAAGGGGGLAAAFAAAARTESDCSSASAGGDLGNFGPGAMQKPFEDAAFALDVGELSGVVASDSGLHIILRTA